MISSLTNGPYVVPGFSRKLTTVSEFLSMHGEGHLPVVHEQQELTMVLPLIVVDGDGLPLLGRNWLEEMKFIWRNIFHVSKTDILSDVLSRHKMVFDKGQATIKRFKADIKLQDSAKPIFYNAGPALYARCQKMEDELDRLEKLGVKEGGTE